MLSHSPHSNRENPFFSNAGKASSLAHSGQFALTGDSIIAGRAARGKLPCSE